MLTRPRATGAFGPQPAPKTLSLYNERKSCMKRASVALAVLVLFASALLPSTAAASEAWILNIPVRFIPNQETGMVRATLELSAAPAGSQLVVNGSTTLNLGDTL